MKFLVDINLSPKWIEFFAEAGFEAAHWSTVGPSNAPDEQLMQRAADLGYIVVTNDLGYGAILAATRQTKPSVVVVRSDALMPASIGAALLAAIKQVQDDLLNGAVLSFDAERGRLRVLPFSE